jgi:WD40 repeat protein
MQNEIFKEKKELISIGSTINQIKLIEIKKPEKNFEKYNIDFYDKENNIYFTEKFSLENFNFILCTVDMSGYLTIIKFKFEENFSEPKIYKKIKFNCNIINTDNSLWSIDCFFPYVIVGGNHKLAFLLDINIDEKDDNNNHNENENFNSDGDFMIYKKSLKLNGNKHNIPYVGFSPNGEFICMNSVDSRPKIYDLNSGKILAVLENKGLREM